MSFRSQFLKDCHTIPTNLPFNKIKRNFIDSVTDPEIDITVVSAETGSGKTVMASVSLAEIGLKSMTAIPLTVATEAMHAYLKENARNEHDVGYACKGEVYYDENALVKIVTTKHGFNCIKRVLSNHKKFILGKKFKGPRKFADNFVFVLDEAHHTTQENLGTFKLACQALKNGLLKKLVVMSATLGNMDFSGFRTRHLLAEGRSFGIDIFYNSCDVDLTDPSKMTNAVTTKILSIFNGVNNILAFVPGSADVEAVATSLENSTIKDVIEVKRLYSQMDSAESSEATQPLTSGKVKIVVSTNVAESAVTIPDIDDVIDSCAQKTPTSSSNGCGMVLVTEFAPKDKLTQRAGRSGRTKKGRCFRLITETKYNNLLNCDLSDMEKIFPYEMVIELLAEDLDAQDLLGLPTPRYSHIVEKLTRLNLVEECDGVLQVTSMGRNISRFPYSIENAVVAYKLSQLAKNHENNTIVLLAAICMSAVEGSQGNNFFFVPKQHRKNKAMYLEMQFEHLKGNSDFETFINIFSEMFEYACDNFNGKKHVDKICAEYAKDNSMNNKLLKRMRKCFIRLTNLLYSCSYKDKDFVQAVIDYGIRRSICYDSHLMNAVYSVFASAHSDKMFDCPQNVNGRLNYSKAGEFGSSYQIDNVRSFFRTTGDSAIIALQVVHIKAGTKALNCISCIFPTPLSPAGVQISEHEIASDVQSLDNLDVNMTNLLISDVCKFSSSKEEITKTSNESDDEEEFDISLLVRSGRR